jgi:alpha-glucosidase (family GH31 glycosyl hydrolase)
MTVHAYIPQDVWYEFPSGVQVKSVGQFVDFDAPLSKINVHVRGGFIIPILDVEIHSYYLLLNLNRVMQVEICTGMMVIQLVCFVRSVINEYVSLFTLQIRLTRKHTTISISLSHLQ